MNKKFEITDIRGFIRRRKKAFLLTFFLLFIVGLTIALALPPIYVSESVIRIEEQQIPKDYVKPTVSEFIEERIEKLGQQILVPPKLLNIINEYNLYSKEKTNGNMNNLVSRFRKDITIETVNAEINSSTSTRNKYVTVAFKLSFEGEDPRTTQKVVDKLTQLYLEEDLKSREKIASATTDFFESEISRLKEQIQQQELKISQFKKKHHGELPSDTAANYMAIARLEREKDSLENKLSLLREKRIILESQLETTDPLTPIVVDGKDIAMNPKERLKELHFRLSSLRAIYSEKHPDIKQVKREIKELETRTNISRETADKIKKLNDLENQLAIKQANLGSTHPDVKALSKEINQLSAQLDRELSNQIKADYSKEKPDNPEYINIAAQIKAADLEINSLLNEIEKVSASIRAYETKVINAPAIEKEYIELTRDYEIATQKYSELLNKLQEAKIAEQMEEQKQGERFQIISNANLPQFPAKPNRRLIVLLSAIFAFTAASFFITFKEGLDDSIIGEDQIKEITNVPVLSSLNYLATKHEKWSKRFRNFFWLVIIAGLIAGGVYYVDQNIIDVRSLWEVVVERVNFIV